MAQYIFFVSSSYIIRLLLPSHHQPFSATGWVMTVSSPQLVIIKISRWIYFRRKPLNNSPHTRLVKLKVKSCWGVIAVWRFADCSPCKGNDVPYPHDVHYFMICFGALLHLLHRNKYLLGFSHSAAKAISWMVKQYPFINMCQVHFAYGTIKFYGAILWHDMK